MSVALANAWADEYRPPNDRAIAMAKAYVEEGLTLQEIGDRYGITRERVRQIILPFGLEPHHGRRRRQERERVLRETHERIQSGASSVNDEYQALGYATGDGLRSAFYAIGLHLRTGEPPPHGTNARYRQGCKCDECRRAHRENVYAWRREHGVREHGIASSYFNYGCRCPECREAAGLQRRAARARRRQDLETAT